MTQTPPLQLFAGVDGIHKMEARGGVLIVLGTYTITYGNRNDIVHRFRPWAFCFAETENETVRVQ
jgi:hypothetical protein